MRTTVPKTFLSKWNFSSALQSEGEAKFSRPLAYLHWSMAASILGCIGFVQAAQQTPKEDTTRKV
jgi:cytochrome b561